MKKLTTHAQARIHVRAPGADGEISRLLKTKNFKVIKQVKENLWAVLIRLKNGEKYVPIVQFVDKTRVIKSTITVLTKEQYEKKYGRIEEHSTPKMTSVRMSDFMDGTTLAALRAAIAE